jgi:ComF family protein
MWNSIKSRRFGLAALALNLLYPSTCPLCKKHSDSREHSPICKNCWDGIKQYLGPACSVCATPLVSEYATICESCINNSPKFSKVLNYGLYSGALAEAINRMKFYGIRQLAKPLTRLLLDLPIPKHNGVLPVPLNKKGLISRGFNQSLLISKILSKELGIPLFTDALLKTKNTLPQIGLNAKQRMKNIKGAFAVGSNINGLKLLLVDDVMTTGATARECSKALINAGAKEVVVVTLARSGMV